MAKENKYKVRRQRLVDAGLKKLEVWVLNTPEKIAEAKALDKKHTVKKGGKDVK